MLEDVGAENFSPAEIGMRSVVLPLLVYLLFVLDWAGWHEGLSASTGVRVYQRGIHTRRVMAILQFHTSRTVSKRLRRRRVFLQGVERHAKFSRKRGDLCDGVHPRSREGSVLIC